MSPETVVPAEIKVVLPLAAAGHLCLFVSHDIAPYLLRTVDNRAAPVEILFVLPLTRGR
jgi:hypothetical protein